MSQLLPRVKQNNYYLKIKEIMKLEIKHLAGYLPYGLEGIYKLSDVVNAPKEELRSKLLTTDSCTFFLKYCKPLLYPLSSLTEYREDLGFVPMDKLRVEGCYITFNNFGIIASQLSDYDFFYIQDVFNNIVEKLHEWHIDWKDKLIENNLAIDKRTIKN